MCQSIGSQKNEVDIVQGVQKCHFDAQNYYKNPKNPLDRKCAVGVQ